MVSKTIVYDHTNDRVENRAGAKPVSSPPQSQQRKHPIPGPIPTRWERITKATDLLYFRMTSAELLALRTVFPDAEVEYDRKPFTEKTRTSVSMTTSTHEWYKYLLQVGYHDASLSFQLALYDNPRALLTILREVQAEERTE